MRFTELLLCVTERFVCSRYTTYLTTNSLLLSLSQPTSVSLYRMQGVQRPKRSERGSEERRQSPTLSLAPRQPVSILIKESLQREPFKVHVAREIGVSLARGWLCTLRDGVSFARTYMESKVAQTGTPSSVSLCSDDPCFPRAKDACYPQGILLQFETMMLEPL